MITYSIGESVEAMVPGMGWVQARFIRHTWNVLTGGTGYGVCIEDENSITTVSAIRKVA